MPSAKSCPVPHDTGPVTLIVQDLTEFGLRVRATLDLPIPNIHPIGSSTSYAASVEGDSGSEILMPRLFVVWQIGCQRGGAGLPRPWHGASISNRRGPRRIRRIR